VSVPHQRVAINREAKAG